MLVPGIHTHAHATMAYRSRTNNRSQLPLILSPPEHVHHQFSPLECERTRVSHFVHETPKAGLPKDWYCGDDFWADLSGLVPQLLLTCQADFHLNIVCCAFTAENREFWDLNPLYVKCVSYTFRDWRPREGWLEDWMSWKLCVFECVLRKQMKNTQNLTKVIKSFQRFFFLSLRIIIASRCHCQFEPRFHSIYILTFRCSRGAAGCIWHTPGDGNDAINA